MSLKQDSTPQPQDKNDTAGAAAGETSALKDAFPGQRIDRRQAARLKYQVVATLEPVANGPAEIRVVTRDADPNGTGFLSSGNLPEGSRAVLHLPAPDGGSEAQRIECRVRRSRELSNGLFEGSVEFFGEQPQFSDTRIRPTPAPKA